MLVSTAKADEIMLNYVNLLLRSAVVKAIESVDAAVMESKVMTRMLFGLAVPEFSNSRRY
jgi:hypothetical protein